MRAEFGEYVDQMADKLVKNKALTQAEWDEFFDRMYSSGVMEVAADEHGVLPIPTLVNNIALAPRVRGARAGDGMDA